MAKKTTAQAAPAALQKKIASRPKPGPSKDKLDKLRDMLREDRTILTRIANGNKLLGELRESHNEYKTKKLPEFMASIGMTSFGLEAEDDFPAYDAVRKPFYSANIKADWPQEQRDASYEYLAEIGHDDLIKNIVVFDFDRNASQKDIAKFVALARKITVGRGKNKLDVPTPTVDRGVHAGALTARLRVMVEEDKFIPDLEKIGGFIGEVVELKEVKPKKARGKNE